MGETEPVEEVQFVCPECAETIAVNQLMRDALVEHGCVICGTSVDDADFR